MGQIDGIVKKYMANKTVFAAAFDYLLYRGKNERINPDSLEEVDPTALDVVFGNGTQEVVQKYRDLLRSTVIKNDDTATYILLGIESEADVKYAEPVKVGLYDFLQYSEQVQQTAAKHRAARDWKDRNNGEYLSGFYKGDRLKPVITLVILFNPEGWDGPRSLHEMMAISQDSPLLNYVADYRLNLIDPAALSRDDLDQMQSSLKAVLGCIKYSKKDDKDAFAEFVRSDSSFRNLDADAVRVINACTNAKIVIKERAKVVDMCGAIEGLIEDAERKVLQNSLCSSVRNVMESLKVDREAAMITLKVSEEHKSFLRDKIPLTLP